jgi:cobalt-zinc-cadmium resistance protein CzcA
MLVYIPLLTFSGVEGKMFEPMALTVIIALLAAFVLSLTFVPAMIAIAVTGRVQEKPNRLVRGLADLYRSALTRSLKVPGLVLGVGAAAFALSVMVFLSLGQEFNPTLDEKNLVIEARRIPSTSLAQSQAMQLDLEQAVSKFREVAFAFSRVGTPDIAADPMPPNAADTYVILKPQQEWPDPSLTKAELIERMEPELQKLVGTSFSFSQPIQMRFNELIAGVRGDVAIKVYGDDFDKMQQTAEQILDVLQGIRGAADAKVEQTAGLPVLTVDIDRDAVARYGLSMADVQDVVAAAMGGREAGLVFEGDRRFDLVVRLPEELRGKLQTLETLPIPLPRGEEPEQSVHLASQRFGKESERAEIGFIPLSHIASVSIAEGTNQISRENGKRRIVVQSNVRGRDLGSFVQEAQAKVASVPLPPGGWLVWGGTYENLVAAKQRLSVVVPVCFLLIFLLLFATFKSVKYSLLVFSAVPLGLTGGIVSLWLRDLPFSISAAVGFIALSGVAVLNGLVMVTFINQLRREGVPRDEAIHNGALTRLRPVLMTALVASLGFVPMALATGTGAEVQRPLATVVIGGLITSTFLTLLVLPALYRIFTGWDPSGLPAPVHQQCEDPDVDTGGRPPAAARIEPTPPKHP